jgi:RNA polymerase sigma-70 factor (ECF subfamily)
MINSGNIKAIYLRYHPILTAYGKTITPDIQLIEDTIQELFLALLQKEATFEFHASLERYLLVSFRNNLRRKLREKPVIHLEFDLPDTMDSSQLPEQEKKLVKLLEQLPPRQKEVLFLRFYQGKSYSEIADIMGISYQVCRNFSYRALLFLKKNIGKLYGLLSAVL